MSVPEHLQRHSRDQVGFTTGTGSGTSESTNSESAGGVETVSECERQDKGAAPYLNYLMKIPRDFRLLWSRQVARPERAFAVDPRQRRAGGDGTW